MSPPLLFHVVALCLLKAVSSSKVSPSGQWLDCGSGNLGFISPLPQIACMSLCCCLIWLKSEFPWLERHLVLAFWL